MKSVRERVSKRRVVGQSTQDEERGRAKGAKWLVPRAESN